MAASNELSIFNFNTKDIRVVTINDQPWFVAADVCKALGIKQAVATVREMPAHQWQQVSRSNVTIHHISFPNRGAICVSEGGLYDLLFNSRKPAAKEFKLWVTDVVLPAIRKDGAYIMGEEKVASGEMSEDEFWAKAVMMAERKLSRLKSRAEIH